MTQWPPGRAEKVLLDVFKRKQIAIRTPIDIEQLAINCDSKIVLMTGLKKRGVDGLTGRNQYESYQAKYLIIVDDGLSKRDYRMTVAEEVSHIIFDEAELASIRTLQDAIDINTRCRSTWLEREFNREMIGRIALMPSDLLYKELRATYSICIEKNGFVGLFENIIREVAKVFEVPQDSVRKRLKEANYDLEVLLMRSIGNRDLKLPKPEKTSRTMSLFTWGGVD